MVDILCMNRQLTFITETSELLMNSYAKFDLLGVNIKCATACSLKKSKEK